MTPYTKWLLIIAGVCVLLLVADEVQQWVSHWLRKRMERRR